MVAMILKKIVKNARKKVESRKKDYFINTCSVRYLQIMFKGRVYFNYLKNLTKGFKKKAVAVMSITKNVRKPKGLK